MSKPTMELNKTRGLIESDVDFDLNRLAAVTADLLDHARNRPDLLARDRSMIADSVQQLARMVAQL